MSAGTTIVQKPAERAILVGIEFRREPSPWQVEDSLEELAALADTAGLVVVGRLSQRLDRPHPATLIGTGKLEELVALCQEYQADVVIFDEELSPRQIRELEETLGEEIKVLDRTALILDIFAQHAHTREGALQVELAQYEYRLPRLTRVWANFAQQTGGRAGGATGGVGVRGPGETQLEVDRRRIRRRIAQLRQEIEQIRTHRRVQRKKRRREGLPVIALVGYTNAGKSTLLNTLASADVLAEDKLFATLDPTTRRVDLPGGGTILLTDTVGFIQKLPHQLIAAFRATLEEVQEADLLIHVIDVTHPNASLQYQTVLETLKEIHADQIPVITALNKIDRIPSKEARAEAIRQIPEPDAVPISALTGEGLPDLLARVEEELERSMRPIEVLIPYERGDLVALFHERGLIEREHHTKAGTYILGRLPVALAEQLLNELGSVPQPQEE